MTPIESVFSLLVSLFGLLNQSVFGIPLYTLVFIPFVLTLVAKWVYGKR